MLFCNPLITNTKFLSNFTQILIKFLSNFTLIKFNKTLIRVLLVFYTILTFRWNYKRLLTLVVIS